MMVIPVIDLMRGRVVRAVRGRRHAYQPIVSALVPGCSEPVSLARALCAHCTADSLYVADLDALAGDPVQVDMLRDLLAAVPAVTLWVDAGFSGFAEVAALRRRIGVLAGRVRPVFASESLPSPEALAGCFQAEPDGVLSLDRRDGLRLDAAGCWASPQHWPRNVIVMTLERVGADEGPDLDTLRSLRAQSPSTQFIGAGGIRGLPDLAQARTAGAHGWLVASALHDGRLPPMGPAACSGGQGLAGIPAQASCFVPPPSTG